MKPLLFSLLIAITWPSLAAAPEAAPPAPANVAQLKALNARYAPVALKVDLSGLPISERKAMAKLIEAARVVDRLQLRQRWSGNEALWATLKRDRSALGKARLAAFWLNKGPWAIIDDNQRFLPPHVAGQAIPPRKPLGANFYPENATKAELETWMAGLPAPQREAAQWFFTTIRRDDKGQLRVVKFSDEYRPELEQLARLVREAAGLTTNASLKRFLLLRAEAFLTNEYMPSDLAWMDLDSPLDVTIGPYETYNDELFGYKAAFEAYVNVRDEAETRKLRFFASHLQELENNLPIDPKYRNPKLGAQAPIVVVNEVFGAGDGNMGVQTAAYNLPNDERTISQRGSKRVMLKNIQRAKFRSTLTPIAQRVLKPDAFADLDFDAFFTHILAHEITHGLGPHITQAGGQPSTPRQDLKETYSTIEEAKADATGLWALGYMMDKGLLKDTLGQGEQAKRRLYNTFLASAFRTLHFGMTSSHARGMAIQLNYLLDKGGFVSHGDGTFSVDFAKIGQAVADLDRELLTIEATGDYARAKALMDKLVVIRPDVRKALDRIKTVPNDIRPAYITAEQLAPARSR